MTNQSAIDGWGVHRIHTSPIWSRRLPGDEPLPPVPPKLQASELTIDEGGRVKAAAGSTVGQVLPARAAVDGAIEAASMVGFCLGRSFRRHYLDGGGADRGAFWYELPSGGRGFALFSVPPLILNNQELGPLGLVQAVQDSSVDTSKAASGRRVKAGQLRLQDESFSSAVLPLDARLRVL